MELQVEFVSGINTKDLISKVSSLTHPQIIFWYIGCNGLKERTAHFYRDALINPLLNSPCSPSFWLYDLTAWNAFKTKKYPITKKSSCCEKLSQILPGTLFCISSADILSNFPQTNWMTSILKRKSIYSASSKFSYSNIPLDTVFSDISLTSSLLETDASKAYSAFQYLEAFLLIEKLLRSRNTTAHEIIFALPNDELKYYPQDIFEDDLRSFLQHTFPTQELSNYHISVRFLSFFYGSQETQRPYNARGKTLSHQQVNILEVIGELSNC